MQKFSPPFVCLGPDATFSGELGAFFPREASWWLQHLSNGHVPSRFRLLSHRQSGAVKLEDAGSSR